MFDNEKQFKWIVCQLRIKGIFSKTGKTRINNLKCDLKLKKNHFRLKKLKNTISVNEDNISSFENEFQVANCVCHESDLNVCWLSTLQFEEIYAAQPAKKCRAHR